MSSVMKVSCVWALVCIVLVSVGGMLHLNTSRTVTEDTNCWLSLANKTLDAAFENEQALMAVAKKQEVLMAIATKVIVAQSQELDTRAEASEQCYDESLILRQYCTDVGVLIERAGPGVYDEELQAAVGVLCESSQNMVHSLYDIVMTDYINPNSEVPVEPEL